MSYTKLPKKYIRIPVEIITEKRSHRTDSIFYAGKNIARVSILNREYVLTTAGEYEFWYNGKFYDEHAPMLKRYKNIWLRQMEDSGKMVVDNWGWFGINVWIDGKCQDYPTDVYSEYDEALNAFIEFVEKDLNKKR